MLYLVGGRLCGFNKRQKYFIPTTCWSPAANINTYPQLSRLWRYLSWMEILTLIFIIVKL